MKMNFTSYPLLILIMLNSSVFAGGPGKKEEQGQVVDEFLRVFNDHNPEPVVPAPTFTDLINRKICETTGGEIENLSQAIDKIGGGLLYYFGVPPVPLKSYLKSFSPKTTFIDRTNSQSGDLKSEIEKNMLPVTDLTEEEQKFWPLKKEGIPQVYSQLLADIKRGQLTLISNGKTLFTPEDGKSIVKASALILQLFRKIKQEAFESIFEYASKSPRYYSKDDPMEHILNGKAMDDTIHRILSSRTQTFDPETIFFIKEQLKPELSPMIAFSGKNRDHIIEIEGDKLHAITNMYLHLRDMTVMDEKGDPKAIGWIKTQRKLTFDLLTGAYAHEEISTEPLNLAPHKIPDHFKADEETDEIKEAKDDQIEDDFQIVLPSSDYFEFQYIF